MPALPVVPMSSNQATFIELTNKPRVASPVAWVASAGTASIQLVPQNLARRGLLIANPGSANLLICPAIDSNGNPLAAGGAGSLLLSAGQWINFGLETSCGVGWNVAASTGSSNPVTAWEFF